MKICYYTSDINIYDLGLCFLPLYKSKREAFAALTDHLQADSRNVTHGGMPFSTKSSHQKFVIFINEVQAASVGHEGQNLLAVFDLLHLDTLPDGWAGLLGFTPTFSSTIPLAWEVPPNGLALRAVPRYVFLYCLSCHFWTC